MAQRLSVLCWAVLSHLAVSDSLQPMDYTASQAPLSMEFSSQEYWSELSCPPPGDLPDPGIEPTSLASPALRLMSVYHMFNGLPL